jgi:hypothetical protein
MAEHAERHRQDLADGYQAYGLTICAADASLQHEDAQIFDEFPFGKFDVLPEAARKRRSPIRDPDKMRDDMAELRPVSFHKTGPYSSEKVATEN